MRREVTLRHRERAARHLPDRRRAGRGDGGPRDGDVSGRGAARHFALVVAASAAVIAALAAGLASQVGRPYPGFFIALDHRVFPVDPAARAAGLAFGDRIVAVDGRSPLPLAAGAPLDARGPCATRSSAAGARSPSSSRRPVHLEPPRRSLRRLLRGVGGDAGRRRRGVPAEPRGAAQPLLPHLYVPVGGVQRGRARGDPRRAQVRRRRWSASSRRSCPCTAGCSSSPIPPIPPARHGSRATAWSRASTARRSPSAPR